MSILTNLTENEIGILKSRTTMDLSDETLMMKVFLSINRLDRPMFLTSNDGTIGDELTGNSINEMSEGDPEVAKLLIRAVERDGGRKKNELLLRYIFDIKDPREDEMQRKLAPFLVKDLRSITGLSQKAFAEKFDVSIKSIQAWESGSKKISKYAYKYLNSCLVDKIKAIKDKRAFEIPLEALDRATHEFIRKSSEMTSDELYSDGKHPCVQKIAEKDDEGRTYILSINDDAADVIVNGEEIKNYIVKCYPKELQAYLETASKYNCDELCFVEHKDPELYMLFDGMTADEKVEKIMRGDFL